MKHFLVSIFLLIGSTSNLPDNLTITYEGDTIASVNRTYFANPLINLPIADHDKLEAFIQRLEKSVYVPPANASIDKHGNIISEKVGYTLDREIFKRLFYTYFFTKDASTIEAPMRKVYPAVDSELLSQIRVKRIGQYATYFNSSNQERSHNIVLASEAINNQVIFPGETFSFNKTVGKRTKEKGYLRAPVIVRGELSEDIGGGICQISSTLYNAVDSAGMTITERYSHSKRVAYVPPGRDATVSWYGPDFRFTNNYQQPILIRSHVYGGTASIVIYSSEDLKISPRKVPSASFKLPEKESMGSEENREN
ncbi:VanW family protein [Heyndrickxia sp. FSL W8-0423]|uniref:VanW family protein n=1 Tax=Heyndrickxia sp. FSL W8-0423 TaxID=2921601 RepID=UPI0030FB6499